MSPTRRLFDEIFGAGKTVHGTHGGVQVKFRPFDFGLVLPLFLRNFLDGVGKENIFVLIGVKADGAFGAHVYSFKGGECFGKIFLFLVFEEAFATYAVGIVSQGEGNHLGAALKFVGVHGSGRNEPLNQNIFHLAPYFL